MTNHEPTTIPIDRSFERGEPTERLHRFVETLVRTGVQRLHTPRHLAGREFFVTCRTVGNKAYPDGRIPKDQFKEWGRNFTEALILDAFEAIPANSQQLVPVGHTDVHIATLTHGPDQLLLVIAQRDMSVTQYRKASDMRTVLPEPFATATAEADGIWRLNATDVIDSVEQLPGQLIWVNQFKSLLDRYGVSHDISWRNKGFGSLLTGLQLELLHQRGAQSLALPSGSRDAKRVFEKMALRNPAARIVNDTINLSQVKPSDYVLLAEQFIP